MIFRRMMPVFCCLVLMISCNKVIEEVPLPPFEIFPNPCVNVFFVRLDANFFGSNPARIRLLDGKKVLLEQPVLFPNETIVLSLDGHDAGVYHVEVSANGLIFTEPVIKIE
mgnify:CR=1 FL=1